MLTLTEDLALQPTLSLYLGGSGIAVGKSLLAQMESLPPDAQKVVEPFFIDSQKPAIEDHSRVCHFYYRSLSEFFEPIYQEFTEQRFPENLGVSPVINSCLGCGVTRIFGAASLVARRDDFVNVIEPAVGRLRGQRATTSQSLQVFITASACGGTGAGMVIDAAALVRHYFRERGENPRIFLFLIGPSVYLDDSTISLRQDQRDRMQASTYALLKELHHYAEGNPFRSAYRMRDKVIEIGNARDDDRLFEWVYYIDGRSDQTESTRGIAEVAWTIAETQLHLAVTEVGRKVNESMPNQREERMRDFVLNFVHADNKDRLSDPTRRRLDRASRKTFMASFAVRNVRFPAEEIKTWFRRCWVRDGLRQALDGKYESGQAPIDRFDEVLGWNGRTMEPEGLFADLGLTRDQLLRDLTDANPASGVPETPGESAAPGKIAASADELIAYAEALIAEIRSQSSVLRGSAAPLLDRAMSQWSGMWSRELADGGKISERLWNLAADPASGSGLRFVDGLLDRAAELLTRLAASGKASQNVAGLDEETELIRGSANLLRRRSLRESGLRFHLRGLIAKATNTPPWSVDVQNGARGLARRLRRFREEIIALRREQLASSLAPRAWLDAAKELKRWRESILLPAITAATNALTHAANEAALARHALSRHSGTNARGRWEAFTTVLLADESLLRSLSARLTKVSSADLVLAPLQEKGISREHRRLDIRTLAEFDRETTVDMLFGHVEAETRLVLTFLDSGWMLDEVAARLHTTAAEVLDEGCEPLVSFSRASLGQPLQAYLLTPPGLILPQPFGQRLERMNRLVACDPLQLGIVTFVFGIPPNALETSGDLFEQYVNHIGDQARNAASDRFPLHVFRSAPEAFNEVHSPLLFQMNDTTAQEVLDAARVLWPHGIRLDIREFNEELFLDDSNQCIELTEKVIRHLMRNSSEARQLFRGGRFPDVERIWNSRRFRSAETWAQTKPAG